MANSMTNNQDITLLLQQIEQLTLFGYLVQQTELSQNHLKADFKRKILKYAIPNSIKAKMFNQHILRIITYYSEHES